MKKLLITIGKALGFFILWAILASMDFLYEPQFIYGNPAVTRLWWELVPLIVTIIVTLIFEKGIEKGRVHIQLIGQPFRDFILGILLGAIWLGITIFILRYLGVIQFDSKNVVNYMWVWLIAAFINVVMQEYLIRGYIFQIFKSNYNSIVATIVSTLIFTALHGGAFEVGIVAVLNVLTMSIFVSLLLIYTKTLIAPIIVHFIWNAVGCLYLGGVSLADDYPNLWNCTFTGSKLLTGGIAKIEGSVIVSAMNIIMIIIVGVMISRGQSSNQRKGVF
ncbi:CPBP family intramembrane glutamic endopeptidase [Xylanivirga thermophila]|uniref:CPBP family intramembrane glutamic endopeptidase n=1 Tax=Xylanivirga thermophila TaxID=2496273 RepID=UPI00101BE0B2|nr:type II CAAX endopeptidase family protein [Xylanivirga thermophila]